MNTEQTAVLNFRRLFILWFIFIIYNYIYIYLFYLCIHNYLFSKIL